MDGVKKFKLVKFIGEVISNPTKFKDYVQVKTVQDVKNGKDDRVYVEAFFSGPVADFMRELNVEGTMAKEESCSTGAASSGTLEKRSTSKTDRV